MLFLRLHRKLCVNTQGCCFHGRMKLISVMRIWWHVKRPYLGAVDSTCDTCVIFIKTSGHEGRVLP